MNTFNRLVVAVLAAVVFIPAVQAADPPAGTIDAALAIRLAEMAQNNVRGPAPTEATLRQSVALMDAARRLDPSQSNYARLSADVHILLHNTDAARESIIAFRKLEPKDKTAQIEYIDLMVEQMQTIDKKVAYLTELVGKEVLAPELRSAVALRASRLHEERGQSDLVMEMIDKAIALNPLNSAALRTRYRLLAPGASPEERFAMQVAMLRANPAQPDLIMTVADSIADAGLVNESKIWYSYAGNAFARTPGGVSSNLALKISAQLFLVEQSSDAKVILDQILAGNPDDYAAAVLRMLIERRGGQKEIAAKLQTQARNTIVNRLAVVRTKLGVKGAATRPSNEGALPSPDLSADAELYKKAEDKDLKADYLQAIGDLAWFDIYYAVQPDEADKSMQVFGALADRENKASATFAARVAGWMAMAKNPAGPEAKVKLSAVAERDPLAALGLLKIAAANPQELAKAKIDAQKLLDAYPSGVHAVVLYDALRDLGVKVAPAPRSKAMLEALAKLPVNWMRIVDAPQIFYSIRTEPVRISHGLAEPMLARVTIINVSDTDISVGRDGVIQPDLIFDAQTMTPYRGNFFSVAVERIGGEWVLHPRQSTTTLVRLDQGELSRFLIQTPSPSISVQAVGRTNPLPIPKAVLSGPAGYAVEFSRLMERTPFPMTDKAFAAAVQLVSTAEGSERIRYLDVISIFSASLAPSAKENPEIKTVYQSLVGALDKTRSDTNPSVRAWASALYALAGPAEERERVIQKMLVDESWQVRLLGMTQINAMAPDRAKITLKDSAAKDADPLIKSFAAATLDLLENPPATTTTKPAEK